MSDTGFLAAGANARYRTILRNVYLWMTVGLGLTALVAWYTAQPGSPLRGIVFSPVIYVLMIAELILVIVLSRNIMRMSVGSAVGLFLAYSFLNGLTMSFIFLAYTGAAIFQAFAVAGGMFAVMSLWAVTTKRDLSGWGHYLFMGLIGLIIAGLVGFFVGGETFNLLYSSAGVILFTLLTAYDTQRIKAMSDQLSGEVGENDYVRMSILGALRLYLDFINMFLFLLRIFGRRR